MQESNLKEKVNQGGFRLFKNDIIPSSPQIIGSFSRIKDCAAIKNYIQ